MSDQVPMAGPPLQVSEQKYSASFQSDGAEPRVVVRGTISSPAPGAVLNPFVDAVHEAAQRLAVKELRVDFTDLEFCNSSGFKTFIHWIQLIQALPAERRYVLCFVANPARKWQRTSLLALSCYGVEMVRIA